MERKEITEVVASLIGVPYNESKELPDSVANGFKCYTWSYFIYQLAGIDVGDLSGELTALKGLRNKFTVVNDGQYKFLDIPEFYMSPLEVRHIGVFLSDYEFTQCSRNTNGVSINNINNEPWKTTLRRVYRLK